MLLFPTHDLIGDVHLASAWISLLFGTWTLASRKGTARHRQTGYAYVSAMVVMLVTAFLIYRVFDGFGLFHVFAVVATVTLAVGMTPAVLRLRGWLHWHVGSMYWSVIGLYAAFVSETVVRLIELPFFTAIGLLVAGVMVAGEIGWRRFNPRWLGPMRPEREPLNS